MLPPEDTSPRKTFKKLRNSFHLIKSNVGFHHCKWFFLIVLIQLTFILFLAGTSPPTPPPQQQQQQQQPQRNFQISKPQNPKQNNDQKQSKSRVQNVQDLNKFPAKEAHEECENGRVYVYDLPAKFNRDLLNNCHDLDPWSSRCNAISNGGLGPKATGLESVVPKKLLPAWYWTDMYSAEVIYHERMLYHKCRTLEPENATAFYIPFYPGLAIGKLLWFTTAKQRDRPFEEFLEWAEGQPYWEKNNGSDHFLVFGRLTWAFRRKTDDDSDWGTSFLRMPMMQNVLHLGIEKHPWGEDLEVSVPYPTAFHPQTEHEIKQWQDLVRSRKRLSQFCFVGAVRKKIKNDFRAVLMKYCKSESSCKVVDCSGKRCYDGAPAILEAFLDSDFCLQPRGDGFTRRSFFDCMLAGSIPVYFWQGSFKGQYQWHLPLAAENYSVYIDNNEARNDSSIIKKVLDGYTKEDVRKMREILIDAMPKFLYARSNKGLGSSKDAFDIAIDEVLKRFKHQREEQLLEKTRKVAENSIK